MDEQTNKIDAGDYSLRTRTQGTGEPVFFLVPGFADGTDVWEGISTGLASQGRVVLLEQRGHGFSGGPPGPYEWADLGKDVVRSMEQLEVGRATLVGHALGGLACLLAAIEAPERVERAVIIGTAGEMDAKEENWCHEIVKAGRMNALQGIAHAIYGPMSRRAIDGTAKPMIELAKLMETLHKEPITAKLASATCPTLALTGENDPCQAQALAEALPNAQLTILSGLGASPHSEDPAAVLGEIKKFVAA